MFIEEEEEDDDEEEKGNFIGRINRLEEKKEEEFSLSPSLRCRSFFT